MHLIGRRLMCSSSSRLTLKRCCEILGVSEKSDRNEIREAYLLKAKKFHPDSGSPEADAAKFALVEESFRTLIAKCAEKNSSVKDEVEQFDIKHTAPQHRQYLSFDGVGTGTPYQREKQWIELKASRAAQNVMEHRMSKAAATDGALLDQSSNKKQKHDIKTNYGMDRLVEDLIQEAMSKGEFSNLKGSGKPLPSHRNVDPYVDFVTHKVNQILIDNGFAPEWITLQKDIRCDIECLKSCLSDVRNEFGPSPLSPEEMHRWTERTQKYEDFVKKINSKITHYNLVVPILQKQMVFVSLSREADFVLKNGKDNTQIKIKSTKDNIVPHNGEQPNLIASLLSLFSRS